MAQQIQVRRDSAADWTAAAPTLADGEIGFETDTGKFKIGDGSTAWASLDYFDPNAGGAVDSVNAQTGVVVLDADDIDDSATTHRFATAAQLSKLDGIEALADVTDATNVDAAGAVMNSDTSTAAMSFVVDEDNMASDSATKVPTQQSVKAYVDAASGTSGQLLASVEYDPAAAQTFTRTGATTYADVDATNLAVTFTAPASGEVIVGLSALASIDNNYHRWNLREGSTDVAGSAAVVCNLSNPFRCTYRAKFTGLTPDQEYTWKWGFSPSISARTATIHVGGPNDGTRLGPAVMEVWSAGN